MSLVSCIAFTGVGSQCSIFFVVRYFCFVTECKNPKACTILLRGASKDILNEVSKTVHIILRANIFTI